MSREEQLRDAIQAVINSYQNDGDGEPPCFGRPRIKKAWDKVKAILAQPLAPAQQEKLAAAPLHEGAPTNAAYRIWNDLAEFIAFLGPHDNKYKAIAVIRRHIVEMLNNEGVTLAAAPAEVTAEMLRETNVGLGCPLQTDPHGDGREWDFFADALRQRLAAAKGGRG